MKRRELYDLPVGAIMSRWPETVAAFVELRMHCVGCPVAGLQSLSDAACEHGLDCDAVADAILRHMPSPEATADPAPPHRQ